MLSVFWSIQGVLKTLHNILKTLNPAQSVLSTVKHASKRTTRYTVSNTVQNALTTLKHCPKRTTQCNDGAEVQPASAALPVEEAPVAEEVTAWERGEIGQKVNTCSHGGVGLLT